MTNGGVNTLTFTAGSVGTILLSCVETNSAGASSLAGSSAPIVVGMPAVPPAAPATTSAPPQMGVGRLPGTPSVEGGAASYEIPIEVPPGRNGMQPQVSLVYNSRNGNGVAGVGWALRAASTIFRCPRILDADSFAKPVMHDTDDRLCLDGERLVLANTSAGAYGTDKSEYRTEVETFDKITLSGVISDPNSTFEVRHKSGRRSQYAAIQNPSVTKPDTWYLVREFDPQGNCIQYTYVLGPWRQYVVESEVLLFLIQYSGYGSADAGVCTIDGNARKVQFTYSQDRPDKRTTYRYGVPTSVFFRLQSISTTVPALSTAVPARTSTDGTTVRIYNLTYATSNATGRSLLHSVQLCTEATCSIDLALPPTVFAYSDDLPHFENKQPQMYYPDPVTNISRWQTVGPNYRVTLGPDFDGDGTADPVLTQLTPRMTYLYLTGTSSTIRVDTTAFANGYTFSVVGNSGVDFRDQTVLYRDGKALLTGTYGGNLAFAPIANGQIDTSTAAGHMIVTNYPVPATWVGLTAGDQSGDGAPDLGYVDTAQTDQKLQSVVLLGGLTNFSDLSQWQQTGSFKPDTWTPFGMVRTMSQDFNGDGAIDQLFDENPNTFYGIQSEIAFLNRGGTGDHAGPIFFSTMGGPSSSAQGDTQRRWIDVNGDGLPDLYEYSAVYINMGGPAGSTIFKKVPIVGNTIDPLRGKNALVMDVDGDGLPELVVPNYRVTAFCGGDYGKTLPNGEPAYFCGDAFDSAPISYRSYDRSVFAWDAYKFVEQQDGSYQLVLVPNSPAVPPDPSKPPLPALNLLVPTNVPDVVIEDFSGDGLTDVGFSLLNFPNHQEYPDLVAHPDRLGFYTTTNVARAPDLLIQANDGLGAASKWAHRPLVIGPMAQNTPAQANDGLGSCTLPAGQPFYYASHDGSNSTGYSFFTSSMWTVSDFESSNGVGGLNRTCYRYQDAMVSDWGRGFQGFRFITAEQQLPLAAGEDGTNAPTGCGGTCSPNNQRALSEFHQEFPLAGKLKRVTVSLASGPGGTSPVINETLYWWHQLSNPAATNSWVVYSSGSLETKKDLAGDMIAQTTGIVEIDPTSGEATAKCSLSQDATPLQGSSPPQLASISSAETDTLFPNDLVNWALGQLNQRTTQTGFSSQTNPFLLSTNAFAVTSTSCVTRTTGSNPVPGAPMPCGGQAPTCGSLTPTSAGTTTQVRSYTWIPKGVNGYRKLESETLLFNSALESKASYSYDQYGNARQVQVNARDVCEATTCPATTGPATTIIGYEATNYFVSSKQDPKGLVSTLTFAPESGAPACTQEVASNPLGQSAQTCRSYDALGRLSEVTTRDGSGNLVEPAIEVRVSGCAAGNCVMKTQSFQAGAPTKTKYVDLLGRTIAEGAEGFDGAEVITKGDYNARGQEVAEYPPASTGAGAGQWDGVTASPYPTKYVFDAVGRVTSKTVMRDSSLFSGQGDASITTIYKHTVSGLGLLTTISVPKAAAVGGALSMSRTYDRRGHLLETTQDVIVPSARTIKAHYFYDPMGHVTAILDSNGNQITAVYGARSSTNPDRRERKHKHLRLRPRRPEDQTRAATPIILSSARLSSPPTFPAMSGARENSSCSTHMMKTTAA